MVILLYNTQTLSFVFARCSPVVFGLLLLIVLVLVFVRLDFNMRVPWPVPTEVCGNEAVLAVSKTHRPCLSEMFFFTGVFALLDDNSAHAFVDFALSVYKHFQLICLKLPYAKCRVFFFHCFY